MNNEINSYSKQDLKMLLNNLKQYRSLKKSVGKKAGSLIMDKFLNNKKVVVEYNPNFQVETALELIINNYSKVFNFTPTKENIVFKSNVNIIGGVRLYYGDDMMDLSFNETMRKITSYI